jgi:hypothetical protein
MRWTLALAVAALTLPAWAVDVGEIKVAKGVAHVERGTQRLPVKLGMPIQQADKVITGADATVGITFTDNSLLSIGPNSALAIDKYVFDSTTHAGQFDSTLSKGSLAVVSGKIVKQSPEAMRVRTPSAIMGVRGTEFAVRVAEPKQ